MGAGWNLDPAWKPTGRSATRPGFVAVPMAVALRPNASLHFDFSGSAVGVFVVAGPDAGVIEFRIDDGPWQQQDLYTPWSQSGRTCWPTNSLRKRTC